MIARLLSPGGRIGRAAYLGPLAALFALALAGVIGTGMPLSASTIGAVLDRPFTAIGRSLDASVIATLPSALQHAVALAVFTLVTWMVFVLTIKRLHDLGRTGWWSTLLLLPGIGTILMLVCALVPGRQVQT
tara:strand:+ start:341 stop:736 length:396 start_codon:yes stop_codon:yes gene_type:complete